MTSFNSLDLNLCGIFSNTSYSQFDYARFLSDFCLFLLLLRLCTVQHWKIRLTIELLRALIVLAMVSDQSLQKGVGQRVQGWFRLIGAFDYSRDRWTGQAKATKSPWQFDGLCFRYILSHKYRSINNHRVVSQKKKLREFLAFFICSFSIFSCESEKIEKFLKILFGVEKKIC